MDVRYENLFFIVMILFGVSKSYFVKQMLLPWTIYDLSIWDDINVVVFFLLLLFFLKKQSIKI